MRKPHLIFGLLILLIAGIWAYFLLIPQRPAVPTVKLPAEEKKQLPEGKNTTIIKNFSYSPEVLNIKVGETVTWFNEDGVVHTVRSDILKSQNLKNGDIYKYKFDKAGTYEYTCSIHPYMRGKVIVEEKSVQ